MAGDDAFVLLHHTEAVKRVRESLQDPASAAVDDGIIATVIGMVCQCVCTIGRDSGQTVTKTLRST